MLNDPLANVMSNILNYEKIGNKECLVRPASKIIKKIIDVMNEEGYIGKYEEIKDGKSGQLKINLLGRINKCGVIKPRFAVKTTEFEKFEKRFLIAKGLGILIVSTNKGIMTHEKAKKQNLGGRLLVFCY